MLRRFFSFFVLSLVFLGLPVAFTQAAHKNTSYYRLALGNYCANGRSPLLVAVSVTPFVYKNEVSDGRWGLWVANETAWEWKNWGMGNALARSMSPDAGGYVCAKRGDELRINGVFALGDMYLVYRKSSTGSAADQIVNVRLGGRSYDIGDGCKWDGNGMGGYDVVCQIR